MIHLIHISYFFKWSIRVGHFDCIRCLTYDVRLVVTNVNVFVPIEFAWAIFQVGNAPRAHVVIPGNGSQNKRKQSLFIWLHIVFEKWVVFFFHELYSLAIGSVREENYVACFVFRTLWSSASDSRQSGGGSHQYEHQTNERREVFHFQYDWKSETNSF